MRGEKYLHQFGISFVILQFLLLRYGSGNTELKEIPMESKTNYAAAAENNHRGMGPFYDFSRSFINTALPGEFPTKFINDTLNNFNFDDLKEQLLHTFLGYVVAIAVGVLFVVVVPIVGMCFCCCRLCGNCGGKRHQVDTKNLHIMRRVYTSIMFGIATFIMVGNICAFVSNDRMSSALNNFNSTVSNNLDDVDRYLNFVSDQLNVVGVENINITKKSISNRMSTQALADDITTFAIDKVSGGALSRMQNNIERTFAAFKDANSRINDVNNVAPRCNLAVPSAVLSSFQNQMSVFDNFTGNDINAQAKQNLSKYIEKRLSSSSVNLTKINETFDEIEHEVSVIFKKIMEVITDIRNGTNVPSMKKKVQDTMEVVETIDNYRHIAGSAIGAVITVVVSMQVFGLVLGLFGQGMRTEPTQRGCVSNAGGNFLIASVAFMFLFSWLFMLITTVIFAVGAPLERFVCQPLTDTDMPLLNVIDSQLSTEAKFGTTISGILSKCRDGHSAYESFNLSSKLNIDTMDEIIHNKTEVMIKEMDTVLEAAYNTTNITVSDLTPNNAVSNLKDALNDTAFSVMIDHINGILNTNVFSGCAEYETALNNWKSSIETLRNLAGQVDTWTSNFTAAMAIVPESINNKLTSVLSDYKDSILNVAMKYTNSTKKSIQNDIGRCTPLWNVYHSVVVVTLCENTVDSLNGFWFSVGWCLFFFMPGIIFSVKLAKHFRKMEPDVDEESNQEDKDNKTKSVKRLPSNKVVPTDETPVDKC